MRRSVRPGSPTVSCVGVTPLFPEHCPRPLPPPHTSHILPVRVMSPSLCCTEKSEFTKENFLPFQRPKDQTHPYLKPGILPHLLRCSGGQFLRSEPTLPLAFSFIPSHPRPLSFPCTGSFLSANKHAPTSPIIKSTNNKTENLPLTPHILLDPAPFCSLLY